MLRGIDVSDFQNIIDWVKVKAMTDGPISFAYAQATYGAKPGTYAGAEDDYRNATFNHNHDAARTVGLDFGAYHFMKFNQDPVEQAQAFLNFTRGRLGTLLPMVDVEGDSGSLGSPSANVAALAKFLGIVESAIGHRILIYTGAGYWNSAFAGSDAFSGHPLWVANYGVDSPEIPGGWTSYRVWQYESTAAIDGIDGNVDADWLDGDSTTVISRMP